MQASGKSAVGASLITVVLGACVLGPVAPAGAAFPGTNGRIVFDRGVSGQFSIASTRADGSGLKQLAANAFEPRYDATGARIVFVSTAGGIGVMQSDGTSKH